MVGKGNPRGVQEMKTKTKTKSKKANPTATKPTWVEELDIHPDHRHSPLERGEPEYPEGYDPYHGWALEEISY